MLAGYSRRQLLGAGVGGGGAVLAGGYAWSRHATRNHLRFRPLEAINESGATVVLDIVVEREGFEAPRTVRLDEADTGENERQHLPGRWMKSADAWSVRAEYRGQRVDLDADAITERLEGSGWGADCARVAVVVTAAGELTERVRPATRC
jgi:hypothetical protein